MKTPPQKLSNDELQTQREAIRRGLLRANTAAAMILMVVIGLALIAVLEATRAGRERARAISAEADAREKLRDSYLAQARALRQSGMGGRRLDSLDAITKAKEINPPGVSSQRATLELRNEVAACLVLSDLRLATPNPRLPATNVTVDTSGERYAFADEHGAIQVRRLTSDELMLTLPSQSNVVEALYYFSPSNQFLPVRYADGQTLIWNLDRREAVFKLRTRDEFRTLDFSPDDRRLAVEDANGSLLVCDLHSGAVQTLMTNLPWVRPSFSPDGQKLLVASGIKSNALIFEVETGHILAELSHPNWVLSGAWHPRGDWLATGCSADIYFWRPDGQKPFGILSGHQGGVADLAFHPAGNLLLSGSWDGTFRLWDLTTGEALINPLGGDASKFSADGRRLTCYWGNDFLFKTCEIATERVCRFLHIPELAPGELTRLGPDPGGAWSAEFSPDERLLVSSHQDGVRLWDVGSGNLLAHIPGALVLSAFLAPQGDQLFTSGQEGLLRWPVAEILKQGGRAHTIPEQLDPSGSDYNRACMSPDGQEVAYACGSEIRLLNSHLRLDCPPPANFVALSPDRQWVAASPWSKFGVRLWNARTGERVRDFPFIGCVFVAFTPDSRWLVTGAGDEFCFWDVKTRKPGRRIPRHDTSEFPGNLAFSPDRKLLAVAISRTLVELLDASTFEPLVSLQTPKPQMISWIAFSPSSRQLAVATSTPFIQLWDLAALRGELALLGLDWRQDSPTASSLSPSNVQRAGVKDTIVGSVNAAGATQEQRAFLALALGAVALTILLAISVLKRQHKLVQSYSQIDELATQRARELELAHRELLQSEKMKALGTLAAGIAHDFNNLLSVIRLSKDVIGEEAGNRPSVREEVQSIENAVQQGRSVVRSMLGYSREAADKPCFYAVGDVLADSVGLLSKQFLSGIVLTIDVERATPQVWGAPSRLEQILLNLIVNAAEAMKGRGQLIIQARAGNHLPEEKLVLRPTPAEKYVEVSVKDSGPGIAAEVLPRIFEPFFTTKIVGASPGTGLGLSTVYTIAQRDGLGLAVQTAPGEGTTFRLWMPGLENQKSKIKNQKS